MFPRIARGTGKEESYMSTALNRLGAVEAAHKLQRRELTAVQLVRACFARIEQRENAVHAWTALQKQAAIERAEELDRGPVRGPLHGLPIGVKDLFDTVDLPTRYGSPIYDRHRPGLDAASVVARARRAESERRVTLRPAPDTMTYLTALLPVAQGVGVYAALTRAADTARATGDPRPRGQVMADELVARVNAGGGSGITASASNGVTAGGGNDVGVAARLEVQLVMTDRTLLAGDDEPARIPGYGVVPGPWARDLVLDALYNHIQRTSS